MKTYDLVILGAGPAGITASVYAARKRLNFLVISKDIGGQAAISWDIENYTGYQFITGQQLASNFKEHMDSFNIAVNMPEKVKEIKKEAVLVRIITERSEYLSRSLIIATGARSRLLRVKGEEEFKNKGLTYCVTCDGPLFKGKIVAVVGGGNSAVEAALQMVKISPKVYVININSQLEADSIAVEKLKSFSNVEVFNNSKVKKIYGDEFVKGIEVEKNNQIYNLDVRGVFAEIGLIPNSDFIHPLKLNERGEIDIDFCNNTNIEGIFAAGDVSSVCEKQIIIACGEGSKASLKAFRYLSMHKFQ